MPGTYRERVLARWAGGALIPGSGEIVESATARGKADALRDILQEYFQDDSVYRGGDIFLNDAKQAIKYARSKKLTKSNRKGVIAGVKLTGFVVGAATGATVGSVIPVGGTAVGGVVGGVGIAAVVSGSVFTLDHLKRKTKGLYKIIRQTRGEHRNQAARALLNCYQAFGDGDPRHDASFEALIVILDEEFSLVVDDLPASEAITRLADRMKSN